MQSPPPTDLRVDPIVKRTRRDLDISIGFVAVGILSLAIAIGIRLGGVSGSVASSVYVILWGFGPFLFLIGVVFVLLNWWALRRRERILRTRPPRPNSAPPR